MYELGEYGPPGNLLGVASPLEEGCEMESIKLDMAVPDRYDSEHRPLLDSYEQRRHSTYAEKDGWLEMSSLIMIMQYILKCNKQRSALLRALKSLWCVDFHVKAPETSYTKVKRVW